jgi:hypothetical protein
MSIKQLEEVSQTYQKLLKQIEKIDKKYSANYEQPGIDAPETLGLKRLTYNMPGEEEFALYAKDYYKDDQIKERANVNNSAQKDLNDFSLKQQDIITKADDGKKEIEQKKQEDITSAKFTSSAKNLTDSSIATGLIDKVKDTAELNIDGVNKMRDDALSRIDAQIAYLNELRQKKLMDIEEIYRAKISEKVADLKEDSQKKLDQTTKYNNTVDAQEAKYQKSLAKQLSDLEKNEWQRVADILELTEKIGSSGIQKQKEQEKYLSAKQILDEVTPEEALNILKSSNAFALHLGDMYDSLCAYYQNLLG